VHGSCNSPSPGLPCRPVPPWPAVGLGVRGIPPAVSLVSARRPVTTPNRRQIIQVRGKSEHRLCSSQKKRVAGTTGDELHLPVGLTLVLLKAQRDATIFGSDPVPPGGLRTISWGEPPGAGLFSRCCVRTSLDQGGERKEKQSHTEGDRQNRLPERGAG